MNKSLVRAALAVCLLGSAAMVSPAFAMGGGTPSSTPARGAPATGGKVSAPVGKLLQPAGVAMGNNDFAGALVLIKQAQALPDQTAFDTFKINEFLGNVYIHENDHVNAEIAYVAMANSPAMDEATPEEKSSSLRIAALLATEQKHYADGIKFGQAYLALGTNDGSVLASIAQAYYFSNDFANAETYAQKALDAAPATDAPNRSALEIVFGAQLKAKKQDAAIATLERIVTYYNDADEWGQVIDISLGVKGIKDYEALHIYRLRFVTKAKAGPDDYNVAAALALSIGYPVEAEAILNAGSAAGAGPGKQAAEARTRAAADRKTIDGFATLAAKSPTGELDLKLAETLYGYGRFADAAAAARRALQKGGAKANPDEANLVLGESLIQTGDTAGAVAAFNSVKGSAASMRAAHIWLLWANRKYT